MKRKFINCVPTVLGASIGALLMSVPPAAFSQEEEEARSGLDEIIVTARFREENLQTTPVAITAVSGEDLAAMGFANMTEIGRAVPNAYFRQGGSPWGRSNQVFIRGVGQGDFQFTQEPRTATYVDDVYFASVFGSVFDLLDLQQVEVLRGPQGTLFGRNAMGGAIRMVSRKPEGGGLGNMEVTFGDYDRVDLRGSFDQTLIEDKLFMRLSGASKHREGYQQQLDFTCQMIQNGTPELAGIGDGVVGWNADPDGLGPAQGSPIFGAVGSAADNAFSFPKRRVGGGAIENDCVLSDLGGEDVQAARAMLRWVPSDNFEALLTLHYSDDNSSVQASYLAGISDAGGVANTVPGTTTGLPPGVIDYNNAVIGLNWGIAYDSRFIPSDPFTTYATYDDLLTGEQFPPVSTAESEGWSAALDWDLGEDLALKVILADHKVAGQYSHDQDESPLPIFNVWGPVESSESSLEARLSGQAFNDRFEWTVGAFYWEAEQKNGGRVSLPYYRLPFLVFDTDDFNDAENKGFYFHSITSLTERLTMTAGLRTSDDDKLFTFSHFFDATVPGGGESDDWKLGFDYQINDRTMAYIMAASGYTASTFNGRPFTPDQLVAQPPEELVNYEIGVKTDFENVRFNATVFSADYKSRVAGVVTFLDAQGLPNTTAVTGPATIDGVELELSSAIGEFWAVNFALGYLEYDAPAIAAGPPNPLMPCGFSFCAAPQSGAPPGQPQRNASGGVSYFARMPNGGTLTPRLDFFWTDTIESLQPGATIGDYILSNARLTYETPDQDWSLSFAITNLADEFYHINNFDLRAFNIGTFEAQPGRPQEWSLTFRHNFGL
ncbi:MAG TPA: TonB-dependent receptor [Gammaproteobacteria bacterium]